jgi:hypothetical protein
MEDPENPPSEESRARAAREALGEVEQHLAASDVPMARRTFAAARELVGPGEAAWAADLDRRVAARERVAGPGAGFEAARERGDWVAARRYARRACELAEGDEREAWHVAAERCDAKVRSEWRIGEVVLDADAGSTLFDWRDLFGARGNVPPWQLADGGATLVLVCALERWVFLREVDVASRRLRRIGWLRAPESLEGFTPAQVDGESIHLAGSGGGLLQLSRRPLDVVRWASLRPFMLPDRVVGDAFAVPPGRFLWAGIDEPDTNQAVAVVDMEEWRVCRRPPIPWFDPVSGAEPARMLGTDLDWEDTALFDERGARLDWSPPPGCVVRALAAHPAGDGWLALAAVPGDDGEVDGAPLGLVEMRTGRPPAAPRVVAGTDATCASSFAVSLDERLAFLLTPVNGRGHRLFAFRAGPRGLELAWEHEVGGDATLAQDGRGRRVAVIVPGRSGLDLAVLDGTPPALRETPEAVPDLRSDWPRRWECRPQGARLEDALERDLWQAARRGDAARWVELRRKERRRDPEALADLVDVLVRSRLGDLAEPLLSVALERHGDRPRLRLARADVAAASERWGAVEPALAETDPEALPPGHACHLHHLAGVARLHAGDPEAALQHFRAGERIEPEQCGVAWHLEVARALVQPLAAEPEADGSAVRRVIRACRLADARQVKGDAEGALDALAIPEARRAVEPQSAARLAEAHLGLEPASPLAAFTKAVALARVASHRRPFLEGIPGLGWDEDRLAAVAQRARNWLEGFQRREEERPLPEAPTPAPPASDAPPSPIPARPPAGNRQAPGEHALPPVGHESMRALVRGLDAAVRETARYVRALPGVG